MANADAPFGLRPVRHKSGAPYNGAATRYYVPSSDSTAIYIGGLVKLAGSADANGIASVTGNVATADIVLGVVVGVEPVTHESTIYRAASTERYVLVADDPDLIFWAQEDSVAEDMVVGDVGSTADLTGFTSGSTTSGRSSIEIDSSSAGGTTGDHDVQVLGLAQLVNNEVGSNAIWEVRLLNHAKSGDVVGV